MAPRLKAIVRPLVMMKEINLDNTMRLIRLYLYRGLGGLAIGGMGGVIIGASFMRLVFWLRVYPEEPAWIFAGTVVGLIFGTVVGSLLGLIIGLFSAHNVDSCEAMLKPSSLH